MDRHKALSIFGSPKLIQKSSHTYGVIVGATCGRPPLCVGLSDGEGYRAVTDRPYTNEPIGIQPAKRDVKIARPVGNKHNSTNPTSHYNRRS